MIKRLWFIRQSRILNWALEFCGLALVMQSACREPKVSAPHSVVDGHWQTACLPQSDGLASYRVRLDFDDAAKVERKEEFFMDSGCSAPSFEFLYAGSYDLMVTGRDMVYGIDLMFIEQSLRALTLQGTQLLEAKHLCGRSEWPLQTWLSPLAFDPESCPFLGPTPLKNLNLVYVKKNRRLDFAGDLADENLRPIEFVEQPGRVFLPYTQSED